jgi:hypothetical protein
VTDDVRSVVLEDEVGKHEVPATANAFLYVAESPEVGQRVSRVWARTDAGLVAVPFAAAPFGMGGSTPSRPAPPAPKIERLVSGGSIGWLDAREKRGESLDVLPSGKGAIGRQSDMLFGRVLTPDPDRPVRIVLTLNANRRGGPAAGLCITTWARGNGGGGCMVYPGVFDDKPISGGLMGGGSSAFVTVSGVASDDVDHIEALLADGQRADVALRDNVYLVDLPRANLPARIVAYDAESKVMGVSQPWNDFGRPTSAPARGRATTLIRVSGPDGVSGELSVGRSTEGGECMFVKTHVDAQHGGVGGQCFARTWTGAALRLSTSFPPHFVEGRVRSDVKTVRIRFADGTSTDVTPTRGYVLWAAPKENLDHARRATEVVGLRADGSEIARQSLEGPTTRRTSPSRG